MPEYQLNNVSFVQDLGKHREPVMLEQRLGNYPRDRVNEMNH